MNENCRYCKTAKTCLENAEYNSIYCQLHKRIPKVIDKTYEKLQNENQQLKDLIVEKNNQLKDIQNKHTDYTQVNILRMKLDASEKARKEAIEFIKEYEKNQNLLKWNEEDYIDVINEIKKYLDIDKGEMKDE